MTKKEYDEYLERERERERQRSLWVGVRNGLLIELAVITAAAVLGVVL